MKTAGKRWAVCGFIAVVLLAGGLGLWQLVEQRARAATPLPPLEPLPDYLVVYPGPGQAIRSDVQLTFVPLGNTGFDIPTEWQPGYVCVELYADAFLKPGLYWDAGDIVHLSTLTIDSRISTLTGTISDGINATELLVDGEVVASTGGPYGMCWQGPKRTGRHAATYTFDTYSYSWWYEITN